MKTHPHAPLMAMLAANLTAVWIAMSASPAPAAPAALQPPFATASASGSCAAVLAASADPAAQGETEAPPLAAWY